MIAGTVLGRIGKTPRPRAPPPSSPRTSTSRSARPARAPRRSTRSRSSTAGSCSRQPRSTAPPARTPSPTARRSIGQILLASKEQLARQVLADPKLDIYACGRNDIATGQIDRRILALLEYLAARGYSLTITSLKCGHSFLTTSGNQSEHTTGTAVDIATINGLPVLGNQGPGTLAESLVKDVLALQGTMAPHQVISLMNFGGAELRDGRPRRPRPRRLPARGATPTRQRRPAAVRPDPQA